VFTSTAFFISQLNSHRSPAPENREHRSPARPQNRRLSTEGSLIPGETEEDGKLRQEYVLVGDGRAVEFNKAIDGKR
jgi:hypothetical protein